MHEWQELGTRGKEWGFQLSGEIFNEKKSFSRRNLQFMRTIWLLISIVGGGHLEQRDPGLAVHCLMLNGAGR